MTTPAIKIHEIEPGQQNYIDRLLDLFALIFPEYTRYMANIEKSIALGRDFNPNVIPHHWIIEYEGDLVGFTLFNYLINGNFGFGRYIGVDPDFRKSGFGYEIIQQSLVQIRLDAEICGKPQPIGFCAEVETPDQAATAEESRVRNIRLGDFLNRVGAIELNVDYMEPPGIRDKMVTGELVDKPTPMHFILFPDRPDINPDLEETAMMVERVLLDHYLLSPNSELLDAVLRTVGSATQMYQLGD